MDKSVTGNGTVTPEQEDRALFKTYGGPIEVEIVPSFQRPNRQLFLAKGFFQTDTEIIAVFSGRRAQETDALRRSLEALESVAAQRAVAQRCAPPRTEQIRLPVQVKGSWQHRFFSDDDGEDVKIFQLIVGRWAFKDMHGQLRQFGEAPAFDLNTRRRNTSYILQRREIDAVPRNPKFGPDGA